ncbi:MAG: CvpA family protein [Alphaproteobacteria bacterium]|nr:CvpA family protein [Alphaproteobacteria bacterium]
MTPFDIIAGLLLLTSGSIGFARGASRELMSALSFILAAAIALFGLRITGPIFRDLMNPDWAATACALLLVFIVAFVILRILSSSLTAGLHESALGLLDRVVGVGFGLIRALVILGVFNLLFHMATPPDRVPAWVERSIFYPLSEASARVLKVFMPKGSALAEKLAPAIEGAVRGTSDNPSGRKTGEPSYDQNQRQTLDDLVEKSR